MFLTINSENSEAPGLLAGIETSTLKPASPVAQMVKKLPAVQETQVWFLGREDPLEKGMAIHSVFLPGESHGQRSVADYSPRGHKESDMTEQLLTPWSHHPLEALWGVFIQAFLPTAVGKESIDYLDLTREELGLCPRTPLVSQILGFKMKPGLISSRCRMHCGLGKIFLWNRLYSPQNAAGLLGELKILSIGFEFLSNHSCSTRVKKQ